LSNEFPYTDERCKLILEWVSVKPFHDSLTFHERYLLKHSQIYARRLLDKTHKDWGYRFEYTEKEKTTFNEIREKWIKFNKRYGKKKN